MKFAQYLNSHAIDEWRRAYIQVRPRPLSSSWQAHQC